MTIMKRVTAQVGLVVPMGRTASQVKGWICPECHQQSQMVLEHGRFICAICRKVPLS